MKLYIFVSRQKCPSFVPVWQQIYLSSNLINLAASAHPNLGN